MSDPLDWQILPDDAPEDPEPVHPLPAPPSGRSRAVWGTGAVAVIAAAALATLLWPTPSLDTQLHTAVRTVAETESRLSPIPYAIADLGPLQVGALEDVDDGRVRASLTFTATDVDGQTLRFRLDQVLVPEGALLTVARSGDDLHETLDAFPHLTLDVLPQDRAFIERDLAPYLEDVARRACDVWACPPATRARLDFTLDTPSVGDLALQPRVGSWLLAGAGTTFAGPHAELPSPARAGRPADPATLDAYQRRMALRLLPVLAHNALTRMDQRGISPHNAAVAGALATRTAVLLGLEPADVAMVLPAADDAGVISDSPDQGPGLTERALLRLNAFLEEPGSPLERELWQRAQDEPADVLLAAVDLAKTSGRPPLEALNLFFGAALTRDIVSYLTPPDWSALLSCVDGVRVVTAQGSSAVLWETLANHRLLELGPLADDRAYQALVFAGHPLLLESATGRLLWMVWPDPVSGRTPRFAWEDPTLAFDDAWPRGALGAWTTQIQLDQRSGATPPGPAVSGGATIYRWRGSVFTDSLPDEVGNDSRVFHRHQLVDATGAVVADYGLATWPSVNPVTGEIAVLSRVAELDPPEYRLTIYADPTDPVGRVVWRSTEFDWSVDAPLDWAAIHWAPDSREVIGVVRPARSDFVTPLPLLWRTDVQKAQSAELPAPRLASETIFDFSVSADGRYVALVSAANQGPGTQTAIVSTADGELVNAFQLPGGLLDWAPSGHAFTFIGNGRPEVFARPEDRSPLWSFSREACADPIWRPAARFGQAPDVTR